jgi:hypothetical protein
MATKQAGRPKGAIGEHKTKPIPREVLSLWRLRTCLYCRKEYRTGNTDHLNPHSPYCSFFCHTTAAEEAKELARKANEAELAQWRLYEGRKQQEKPTTGVATCPCCSRRIYGDQCYKCHWKAS